MEYLKYVIEDSTIAKLLGIQNFTSDEAAVLELVKNSYDAEAVNLTLEFKSNSLTIKDDGKGMSDEDIKRHWMHIGKSDKGYEVLDKYNNKIVSTEVSYEGKNSQIVVKTVEYENLSTDEIIRTLKVDNVNLVSINDSEARLFDEVNKVKIVITTENNMTIVKFYY